MALRAFEQCYQSLTLYRASVPETLLIVSLRLWMLGRGCPGDPVQNHSPPIPDWRGGLRSIGLHYLAEDVVLPLFECLYGQAGEDETVPLNASRLSAQEINLLTCIQLTQQRRRDDLRALLAGLFFPATARVVVPLLARLTQALTEAGMALPLIEDYGDNAVRMPLRQVVH